MSGFGFNRGKVASPLAGGALPLSKVCFWDGKRTLVQAASSRTWTAENFLGPAYHLPSIEALDDRLFWQWAPSQGWFQFEVRVSL